MWKAFVDKPGDYKIRIAPGIGNSGFTLIELLVVIAVVGVLVVAFLPSILSGPARARDAQRIADLKKIADIMVERDAKGLQIFNSGVNSICYYGNGVSSGANPGFISEIKPIIIDNRMKLKPDNLPLRYCWNGTTQNYAYVIQFLTPRAYIQAQKYKYALLTPVENANSLKAGTETENGARSCKGMNTAGDQAPPDSDKVIEDYSTFGPPLGDRNDCYVIFIK